ncbi:hypothetical protein ACGFNU_45915 [Spirillospora sp. NPDC048911]|uniref:hypothetical protein n=1 Tax=Spirillospora sp. NPDC048911 TaxID=3364527 RepID=UPI0037185EA3
MSEVADQLILEYLGSVADAAHGELSSRERLDFCNRLRKRIEEHRQGSTNPRQIRQVLARFGDPKFLVARERRRLDEIQAAAAGDGEVSEPELADAANAMDTEDAGEKPSRSGRQVRPPRRPRAPVRTVRRGGRSIRRFTWSPSGAARLRRELREDNNRGPFSRLMTSLRESGRSFFRRRRTD